jgi:hypothetical protein
MREPSRRIADVSGARFALALLYCRCCCRGGLENHCPHTHSVFILFLRVLLLGRWCAAAALLLLLLLFRCALRVLSSSSFSSSSCCLLHLCRDVARTNSVSFVA